MPEGDTIHRAARRVGAVLVGRTPDEIVTPQPRHDTDRWPQRLADREVTAVDAHGKHLFIRFAGDLVLHSHLRMTGMWGVYAAGARWSRSPRRAWLVVRAAGREVVQFDGPVLELLTESRTRFDQRLSQLGPDVLGETLDEKAFLRRLREDDPTRPMGAALLDQRNVAGLGTVWVSEGCFEAGVDPRRRAGEVSDEEALAIVRAARPRMQRSVQHGHRAEPPLVYGRAGRPCPRCGSLVRRTGIGDDNRPTYWCQRCQQ